MPGVLPMDNPGRFGAWANGPINDPAASVAPTPSASSTPTSGGTLSSPFGSMDTSNGNGSNSVTSPSSGGTSSGNYGGLGASEWYGPNGGRWNSASGSAVAPWGQGSPGSAGWSQNAPGGSSSGGNGGSYGVGGRGPGGPTGQTYNGQNVMSLDEGGVIDPEDDGDDDDQLPDGNAQSGDPMSVIQNALGWGRQQMGLPKNFFGAQPQTDQTQSFDDGGVIPQQTQQPDQGTGSQLPDPRKTMAYLAGAGNMPPDAAMALEQRVDPQGQMDPAERKLSAITAAGTPQAQFGLMQHYRTRFNAHSAAAQAAMDQGNMALAAQHATEAMSNVPSGNSVKFAPAKGGLAMQSTPIAKKQQQGMDDGGVVKKPPNPEDKWWDPDYHEKIVGGTPYPVPKSDTPDKSKAYAEGGAVDADNPAVMMRSYDDGGEVDSDEDQGVIPTSTAPGASDDTESPPLATAEAPTPVAAPAAKSLLQRGWDWLVENSVGKALQGGTDETAAPPQTPQAQPPAQPATPATPGSDQTGARQQANAIFGAANMGAGNQTPRPTPGYKGTPQEPPSNTFASQYQPRQGDPFAEEFQNLRQQARAMGLSAGPAYQKFMMEGLKDIRNNAARLEQQKAVYGDQGKRGIEQLKQDNLNSRGAARIQEQLQLGLLKSATSASNADINTMSKLIGQQLAANPGAAGNPQAVQKLIAPYMAKAQQMGIDPRSFLGIVQNAQAPQQGAQQPAQAPTTDNQPKKMFNGKAYTKDEWNALQQQGQ